MTGNQSFGVQTYTILREHGVHKRNTLSINMKARFRFCSSVVDIIRGYSCASRRGMRDSRWRCAGEGMRARARRISDKEGKETYEDVHLLVEAIVEEKVVAHPDACVRYFSKPLVRMRMRTPGQHRCKERKRKIGRGTVNYAMP